MSQNSLTLPTTGTVSGLQMTQDMNNAIDTLNTLSAGASAPASPEAGQLWHDTTNNILKLRSDDNTSWIALFYLNQSSYLAGPPSLGQVSGGSNRVLNSGMIIDQMNEGASYAIPVNNTFTYTVDQWQIACLSASASGVTAQRVTDAPPGFTNSLKVTVGTGASTVTTPDYLSFYQPIEGLNISDLNYGTTNAVATSLSFWVKSSIAGTFAATLSSATGGNWNLVHKFTIASAGVWQQITIANIVGPQSGTFATGASVALNIGITVAAGSNYPTATLDSWQNGAYLCSTTQTNSVLTTSGATFQLTGMMWNAGAFCQPYEKRLIQSELTLIQRYFQKSFATGLAVAQNAGTLGAMGKVVQANGNFGDSILLQTPMRAAPTVVTYNPSVANASWRDTSNNVDRTISVGGNGDKSILINGIAGTASSFNLIHWTANARM